MKNPYLLVALALLGLPLVACDNVTPSLQVCTISGQVTVEGMGVSGVLITLSTGESTATDQNGNFRFDNVEGETLTIAISGFPSDATFDETSAIAAIPCDGNIITINFTGSYVRTATVLGTVTIDNTAVPGVTVVLAGTFHSVATTDEDGAFAFEGLRAGSYSIEILSRFETGEVRFPSIKRAFMLDVGEVRVVSFNGTYLRTAGIEGRVSVEGEGLDSVRVSVTGGEDGADVTMVTDSAGQYAFSRLRAGDYVVAISGYDTDDYGFAAASRDVTVALRETATVDFEGILLRTSSITGLVSVDGTGLDRVRVVLTGTVEAETRTMAGGQYAFPGLPAGDYTVAISRFDDSAYTFSTTSVDVALARDEAKIVSFAGSPVGW